MIDLRSPTLRTVAATAAVVAWPVLALAGVDVKINSDAAGTVQNEIRITQNATDANNFVVAYNDNAGAASSPLGVSFSLDAGATWLDRQLGVPTHPILMPPSPDDGISLSFIFDPFIDSDSLGNIYAGYIATDGSGGGPGGIYIERSTDKGATWSGPDTIDFDVRAGMLPPPPMPDPYRFNDRPDMTVDGSDHVYVVWIKDVGQGLPTSDIYFAKSPPPVVPGPMNPTGLDFTGVPAGSIAPKTINDNPGGMPLPAPPSDFANVPDVAVAANGTIYVSWIDVDVTDMNPKPGTLHLDRSTDGGVSFTTDQVAQNITALSNHMSTLGGAMDDARSGSYPAIATNPSSSTTVYMVYAADPMGAADEADIFFTRSTMSGSTATWSTPLTVNDDATTRDQIHPMIVVKSDGTIDVAWYDKRNAANDDMWDVYVAKSTDGGTTFSTNVRVTDQSFATPTNLPGSEPWLGEYLGLVVDATDAYFAFTSAVSGDTKGDVYFDSLANSMVPVELQTFVVE
ncbi:MAG: exo-alpha-sialidase [bacterium]|nr:exo-alpha-sialidase [bacterium]